MRILAKTIDKVRQKYRAMRCIYKTHSHWNDDLIGCPSQCYKHIEYKGKQFVIYLRWRYSDPWSAKIVECIPNGKFYMHSPGCNWHRLRVEYWADDELPELKEEVECRVREWLVKNV